MRQSTRLVANSLVVFAQTILGLFLGLFTSRLVVQALGPVDFGIFVTVGASTALLFIVATALTLASSRHMGAAVGRGDERLVRVLFNTMLVVYLVVALTLLALAAAIAAPLVGLLTMPPERESMALWVVIASAATIGLTCMATPFNAITAAYQRQFEVSFIEIVSSVLRLAAAATLMVIPADRMLLWACALMGVQLIQTITTAVWVRSRIPAAAVSPSLFSWSALREVAGFGGWAMLLVLSFQLQIQGAQIVINKVFGPVANSSFGLGAQLASYQQRIANVVNGSARPAIIAQYGAGQIRIVRRLVLAAGRYTTIAAAFVGVPILFETHSLLEIWLGRGEVAKYPHIVEIAQIVTLWMLIRVMGVGFAFAEDARGEIRTYAIVMLTIDALGLAAAAIVSAGFGAGLTSVPLVLAVSITASFLFRAFYAGSRIGLRFVDGLRWLVVPVVVTIGAGSAAAFAIVSMMSASFWRVPITTASAWLAMCFIGLIIATTTEERAHFVRMARAAAGRLSAGRTGAASPASEEGSDGDATRS